MAQPQAGRPALQDTGLAGNSVRAGLKLSLPQLRPDDVRCGSGEAMSIRKMISVAAATFGSDPKPMFIVGCSARARWQQR